MTIYSIPNYIIATYSITDTSNNTLIIGEDYDLSREFLFDSTGYHEVKIPIKSINMDCGHLFYNCQYLYSVELPITWTAQGLA